MIRPLTKLVSPPPLDSLELLCCRGSSFVAGEMRSCAEANFLHERSSVCAAGQHVRSLALPENVRRVRFATVRGSSFSREASL